MTAPNDGPIDSAALSDAPLQRYVMRLGMDFFLRLAGVFGDLFDGNLLTGLVFLAVAQASVQHHNQPVRRNPAAADGVFPDDMRRSVSVLGVAQFLGIPYETARRHVHLLLEAGYVERRGARGVVVPADVMRRPEIDRAVSANYAYVRQFVAGLQRGAGEVLEA